jgi:dTDP-4-amino-4,6-dideoxygalactose transaminase
LAVSRGSPQGAHQVAPSSATPARLAVARPRLPTAEEVLPYLQRIDEARWYSNFGPLLCEFEARLAGRFRDGTHVVTVANATQALTLALMAMELPPGGHVVIPAWTFVATAHAVAQAGLKPWLVDVDPVTGMLEPPAVLALSRDLARDVAAVIPVCAFGDTSTLARWRAFAHATGVPVLVDAAAAFDAVNDARLPAVVSLHATKALGVGEGGFLATEDADLAARVRKLTTFGFQGSRVAQAPATNAKLSEYAAAVGLAALDAWPGDRLRWMRAAQMLRIALIGRPEVRFQTGWGTDWITSVCVAGLPDGAAPQVTEALAEAGVETRAWWGRGCHLEPAFADCRREALPVTEQLASSTIGLPFCIDMTPDETARLAEALEAALSG